MFLKTRESLLVEAIRLNLEATWDKDLPTGSEPDGVRRSFTAMCLAKGIEFIIVLIAQHATLYSVEVVSKKRKANTASFNPKELKRGQRVEF